MESLLQLPIIMKSENLFVFLFWCDLPMDIKYHDQSSLLKILISTSYGTKIFKIYKGFYRWIEFWKLKYLCDGLFNVFHMTPPKQDSTLLKDTYAPSFLSSCCGNGGATDQSASQVTLNCSHMSFDVCNQNSPRFFNIQGSIEKASESYSLEGNMQYFLKC